jgi:hypothetical protein
MSSLRVLTNAELDIVSGGAIAVAKPEPVRSVGCSPIVRLVEDIIHVVESLEGGNRTVAKRAA